MGIRPKMLNVVFSRCFKRMIVKNNRFYNREKKRSLNITIERIFVKLFKHFTGFVPTLNNTYYFVYRKKL